MKNNKNLIGLKVGMLTVVEKAEPIGNRIAWLCLCECGKTNVIRQHVLVSNRIKSCGCIKKLPRRANIVGQKFNKLTVIEYCYTKNKVAFWKCLCDCGIETIVSGIEIRSGHVQSCGCARINAIIKTGYNNLSNNPRLVCANNVFLGRYNDGNLSFEKFVELSQLNCFYCNKLACDSNLYNKYKREGKFIGISLVDKNDGDFKYNGLDRLNSNRLHDLDNVVPCCKDCNTAKLEMTVEEFKIWQKRSTAWHCYGLTAEELDKAVSLLK